MKIRWLLGTLLLAGGIATGILVSAQSAAPTTNPSATTAAGSQTATHPRNDIPGLGNFAQVSPILYRGEQPTAAGFAALKKMGIKTVIDLRFLHSDRSKLKGTGLLYVGIPCNAWNPEEADVVTFLKVVRDPANQPVFVHCAQGADRTGMMVASYRMVEQGWSDNDAMAELPNFKFHPVWKDIAKYLKNFDVERVKKKLGDGQPVKVEKVD